MPRITAENKSRIRAKDSRYADVKGVCPLCSLVMKDYEPDTKSGEFYHPKTGHCSNDNKTLWFHHPTRRAILFRRKRVRRLMKRIDKGQIK